MNDRTLEPELRFTFGSLARRARNGSASGEVALEAPLEASPDGILGEEAFHVLLATERARAARADRPLALLLVSLKPGPRKVSPIPPAVATKLFKGLGQAVRDTDLVGWYRQDRVAGALLVEGADVREIDGHAGIVQRVSDVLHKRLPSRIARNLHVRVVSSQAKPGNGGGRRRSSR